MAVISFGNPLRGDDAAGDYFILYFNSLLRLNYKKNIKVVKGRDLLDLINLLLEHDVVYCVDCADFKGEPGEYKRVEIDEMASQDLSVSSFHLINFNELRKVMNIMGVKDKKLVFFFIQPSSMEFSEETDVRVKKSAENIAREILNDVDVLCES